MNPQESKNLTRRDVLNIGATTFLGLAFPAGLWEEFRILADHDANITKSYPLTDATIKTDLGHEIRILGVLHTKRGLNRSSKHIRQAVMDSDLVLTENTDLVGVSLEYFNDLARFAIKQGKEVIDVDRFSKSFCDWLVYTYAGSTLLHCASLPAADWGKKHNMPRVTGLSEKLQPAFVSTAILALLATHYSPIRNYGPQALDLSFDATARSLAMYANALEISEVHKDRRITLICGEGHARDIVKFNSQKEVPSESSLMALYKIFLQQPLRFTVT